MGLPHKNPCGAVLWGCPIRTHVGLCYGSVLWGCPTRTHVGFVLWGCPIRNQVGLCYRAAP